MRNKKVFLRDWMMIFAKRGKVTWTGCLAKPDFQVFSVVDDCKYSLVIASHSHTTWLFLLALYVVLTHFTIYTYIRTTSLFAIIITSHHIKYEREEHTAAVVEAAAFLTSDVWSTSGGGGNKCTKCKRFNMHYVLCCITHRFRLCVCKQRGGGMDQHKKEWERIEGMNVLTRVWRETSRVVQRVVQAKK